MTTHGQEKWGKEGIGSSAATCPCGIEVRGKAGTQTALRPANLLLSQPDLGVVGQVFPRSRLSSESPVHPSCKI